MSLEGAQSSTRERLLEAAITLFSPIFVITLCHSLFQCPVSIKSAFFSSALIAAGSVSSYMVMRTERPGAADQVDDGGVARVWFLVAESIDSSRRRRVRASLSSWARRRSRRTSRQPRRLR